MVKKMHIAVLLLVSCFFLLFQFSSINAEESEKAGLISSISFSERSADVIKGKPTNLQAVIEPANAKNKKLEWESSDESIATVKNGRIDGKQNGECDITCKATDGSGISAVCHITVKTEVKSISINEKQVTVSLGSTEEAAKGQLSFSVKPEDSSWQDVVWSSSNENIATVDEHGVVQAVGVGKVNIIASSTQPGKAIRAQVPVSVNQAVEKIELAEESLVLLVNKNAPLKASVSPANASNKKISWSSENEAVATVNQNGQVKGTGFGKTTIVASAADGSGVLAKINVSVIEPVLSVSVDNTTYDYANRARYKAMVRNPDGSMDGLESLFPDANISVTLVTSKGNVVPRFLIQGEDGFSIEGAFPLADESMPAGDYKVRAQTNVNRLRAESDTFYYTADMSHVPDPSECNIELSLDLTTVNINEVFYMRARVTDKNGDPAIGVKVGFRLLNIDRSFSGFYGNYDYISNLTGPEGTCSLGNKFSEEDAKHFKAGKYIAQAFIIGAAGVDEKIVEFTGNPMP